MTKISEYFTRSEMACNCGCGLDSMDIETLKVADEVRWRAGHSITPSSAARCLVYNRTPEVGSNDESQHPKCRAMDLPVNDPPAIYSWLCEKYPNQYGFGLYNSFVHIDTRSGPAARWDNSTNG
jgi:zinc D-Ala-D-Ala carboxypeptidase